MPRVLIVEDESVLRLTFGEFLREEGYEVAVAEDYDEAAAALDEGGIDVIVTDIILAGKTGVDLLRTVRERGLYSPVVMITGEPNVETAAEAVRLGAFDYLAKPVKRHELVRVVRLAIDRRRLAEERDHFAAELDRYRRDLEAIFNSASDGIISLDAQGRIRQVNPAAVQILQADVADAGGKRLNDVLPMPLEAAQEAIAETLAQRRPVPEQRVEYAPPGAPPKVLVVTAAPLMYGGEAFGGALLMLRDITRLSQLEEQVDGVQQYRDMIGKSGRMRDVFRLIKDIAETDSTVLIEGESGTGKELVAAALHHASPRASGPFLKVNCAALSEDILESELFGHVKGAFTGAVSDRVGRFEAASGGTILLDEIGDISPRLQLRLLRVLQEREFERVGSSAPIRTDVHVIASTNQNLAEKIQNGAFRQDLYYRLNVVRIVLPPLRDRRADIPLLVEHFVKRYNRQLKKAIRGVAPETLDIFMRYPWPGNVRELENCIERAFIVCRDIEIRPEHLPPEVSPEGATQAPPMPAPNDASGEAEHIAEVLEDTDWNIAKAARLLGIARNTLYQKLKVYGLERPSE